MTAEEYYSRLLESIKDHEGVKHEFLALKHQAGDWRFLRLWSREIGPEDDIVMITAGIHGDEIAGPLTLMTEVGRIFDYAHRRGVKLVVYPLLNPSGFDSGTRYNIDGERPNNDFVRYELANGKIVDEVRREDDFVRWHWSVDLDLKLPAETELISRLLKKEPLTQMIASLDLHQDLLTENAKPSAYHYSFGQLGAYRSIIRNIARIVPILRKKKIGAGENFAMRSNKDGFIVRHDGTLGDLFTRLGADYVVTAETTGATPLEKARDVNLAWIQGVIDLVHCDARPVPPTSPAILPKEITPLSVVNLVHTSSPVEKQDISDLVDYVARLRRRYVNLKIFDVKRSQLDPRYLAASEKERLAKFRQARKKVDWLAPIYGGTGCPDIIRHLDQDDLNKLRKNRPVVNGFSDTTFLINYLYFKLRLLTFHYVSVCGLYDTDSHEDWFDIIEGRKKSLSYLEKDYDWLTPRPKKPIEGIAIGGNAASFLELLDIAEISVKSWRPYIFFLEDLADDVEDVHRMMIALDQKGIFRNIRALVIGRVDERSWGQDALEYSQTYGGPKPAREPDRIITYLLAPVLSRRIKEKDPLPILKVENFGHKVKKHAMIIPIGGKTIIHPSGKIEFPGPFVK